MLRKNKEPPKKVKEHTSTHFNAILMETEIKHMSDTRKNKARPTYRLETIALCRE